jgi:hypothetical protein
MSQLILEKSSQDYNPTCSELLGMAEHELSAFFGAVTELFGSEEAQLSAEDWLAEFAATKTFPASTCDWRLITFKASTRLADRSGDETPITADAQLEHSVS